jgi:inorganic triphosphatase YgiF
LPGPEVDLERLPDPDLRRRIGPMRPGELRPVFVDRFEREQHLVENGDNAAGGEHVVEVAFDSGEIEADESRQALSEIELELLKGQPAALYELALQMLDIAPLQIQPLAKSDRGFGLASGQPPAWHKALRPALTPEHSLDEALAQIFRACWIQVLVNGPAVLDGRDAEGVHQMRVGLRRLRAALSAAAPMLGAADLGMLKREGRWLAGALGPARDLDVFIGELLPPVRAQRPEDAGIAALAGLAETRRAAAYATARAAVLEPRYTAFLLRLGAWIEARRWRQTAPDAAALAAPATGFAGTLLERRLRKARKRGRGLKRLPAPQRHELRIALKKLRYACEFFHAIYDSKTAERYIRRLARLQDDLGHLNDVAVAEQLTAKLIEDGNDNAVQRAQAVGGAGFVLGWYARVAVESDRQLREHWRDFAGSKPFWRAA